MNIVFVADIFGLTDEFKDLCQQVTASLEKLLAVKCQLHMIGPYQQQPSLFTSESAAYQYFIENITLAGYVKSLKEQLTEITGNKILVGFSIGGSAIWQLCANTRFKENLAAICFYSGQIRHMTKLTPNIPTRLIFPATESHFSITELRTALADKSSVTIEQTQYLHGFMNPLSSNFNQQAYQYYIKRLAGLLAHSSS